MEREQTLDKLFAYQGISPRPHDFDMFWQGELEKMRSVQPTVELTPAGFQTSYAECFDLFFTGIGGARIHAQYLRPKQVQGKNPALLRFHGYTQNAGDFFDSLPYVAAGCCVAVMDCRGQGGLSEDNGTNQTGTFKGHIIRGLNHNDPSRLLYRDIFLDAAQLCGIVMAMEEVDSCRMGTVGYSQGGALALVCAALMPEVKRTAAVFPFLSDYKKAWQLRKRAIAYEELEEYFRWFDPLHRREMEIFELLGYIDVQNFAKKINAKTLFVSCLSDEACPPETQFAVYNKIRAEKRLEIYPDFGHEVVIPGCDDLLFAFMTRHKG